MSAVLAGIGAAAGLASSLYGAHSSAKAGKEQNALIAEQQSDLDQQKADNEAWYNKNYYQNYLDSSEAKAAINRVNDTLKDRNAQAKATAAVTGGTQEAVLAQQANDQQALSDTTTGLAANATAKKQAVENAKIQKDSLTTSQQNAITNAQLGLAQQSGSTGSSLIGVGSSLIGSALSLYD